MVANNLSQGERQGLLQPALSYIMATKLERAISEDMIQLPNERCLEPQQESEVTPPKKCLEEL